MLWLSLIFGAVVGLSLGLTGGGGAIFAVPLLVYGLGVDAREAVAISLAGGVMGIIFGIGIGNVVALLLEASLVFPWDWAAIGLIVCSGIGVGFGFYPAWKASALDPIEALRFE